MTVSSSILQKAQPAQQGFQLIRVTLDVFMTWLFLHESYLRVLSVLNVGVEQRGIQVGAFIASKLKVSMKPDTFIAASWSLEILALVSLRSFIMLGNGREVSGFGAATAEVSAPWLSRHRLIIFDAACCVTMRVDLRRIQASRGHRGLRQRGSTSS